MKTMENNSSLESLSIATSKIKVGELHALVSAPQRNTTLKTLGLQSGFKSHYNSDDEVNQLVPTGASHRAEYSLCGKSNSQGHFEAERGGTPVSNRRRIFHLKRCRRIEHS
jgi:hypothetical protein